jgi:hypothetical protein
MRINASAAPTAPGRAISTTLLAMLLSASCGSGQDSPAQDTGRCGVCDIALEHVGSFSDAFEPGALPDYMVYASQDARGRTFVISRDRHSVFVFDAEGDLVRRLGAAGGGPGEFGTIRRVLHGPEDSTIVTDLGLGRMTVFAPDFKFVRSQPIAHQPDLVLEDGSFVVASQIGAKEHMGYPVHRASRNGQILLSFGADTPQYRPDLRLVSTRWVAASRAGGVWTVAPGEFRIEHWDITSGKKTKTLDVQPQWFNRVEAWPTDESSRPPAIVETLWEDETGIVWVLVRDADLDWRRPDPGTSERRITTEDYAATYDWILLAVDPSASSIMASKRFTKVLWARAGSSTLVTQEVLSARHASFALWKPRLTADMLPQ